jgi:hypothetical protein
MIHFARILATVMFLGWTGLFLLSLVALGFFVMFESKPTADRSQKYLPDDSSRKQRKHSFTRALPLDREHPQEP